MPVTSSITCPDLSHYISGFLQFCVIHKLGNQVTFYGIIQTVHETIEVGAKDVVTVVWVAFSGQVCRVTDHPGSPETEVSPRL